MGNPYSFNDADTRLAGAKSEGAGSADTGGKGVCGPNGWQPDYDMSHPAVQKWHKDAKAHANDPLDIDCHGMITVHNPDALEELSRKALIQIDHKDQAGYKPTYTEILAEEQKFIDLNKDKHPSLDCNKHFIRDGWQLRVPGAPDNCGPTTPEKPLTETQPQPETRPRTPERRTERRPRPGGSGIEIINEPGGVINFNDDVGPSARSPQRRPAGDCPTCEGPSPTWRDPGYSNEGSFYPDTRLQGRSWAGPPPFIGGGVQLELELQHRRRWPRNPGVVYPGQGTWYPGGNGPFANNGQGNWIPEGGWNGQTSTWNNQGTVWNPNAITNNGSNNWRYMRPPRRYQPADWTSDDSGF